MNSADERLEPEPLDASDQELLLDAYRRVLPNGSRIAKLYRWRADRAPSSEGVRTYVIRRAGEVLGGVSAVPHTLRIGAETREGAWYADTFVDPRVRRRGYGSALVQAAADDFSVTMAKGTTDPMYELRKKNGFLDVPNSRYLRKTVDFASRTGLRDRSVDFVTYLWSALRAVPGRARKAGEGLSLEEVDHFDPAFDRLERRREEREVRNGKTADWLNWRYCDCPVQDYDILRAVDEDGLRGAVVLTPPNERGGTGWITDVICPSTDEEAGGFLVEAGSKRLEAAGSRVVMSFATHPRVRGWFRRHGFWETSETPRFTYRGDVPSPSDVPWNFFHGDGDTELWR